MTFDAHRFLGPRVVGFVAILTTGIVGLLAGGAASAFAQAPCEPLASKFVLPSANWTCDGGSLIATGATDSMAVTANPASPATNASTEFSVDVNTNEQVTLGIGMSDSSNGDIITFVPTGVSANGVPVQAGITFSRLDSGVTEPLDSTTLRDLPASDETATLMVRVDEMGTSRSTSTAPSGPASATRTTRPARSASGSTLPRTAALPQPSPTSSKASAFADSSPGTAQLLRRPSDGAAHAPAGTAHPGHTTRRRTGRCRPSPCPFSMQRYSRCSTCAGSTFGSSST